MGKFLHKVFSTIVKDISQELATLGKYGSKVYHFIPEPRNFAEVKKLSEELENLDWKKPQGDKESNQQSNFTDWRSKWRWTSNSIHGCV